MSAVDASSVHRDRDGRAQPRRRSRRSRAPQPARRAAQRGAERGRSRLRRVPARPLPHRVPRGDQARRGEERPKAMTLLGELYADGSAFRNDDKKAAEWYRLAADRGDREAMFALAMFRMAGRGGPRDRDEAREAARRRGQARPQRRGLQSRAALSRGPDFPAGLHPRRRVAAAGRRGRQPGGAIRARHLLQGGPRRAEGPDARRRGCSAPPRSPETPTPRSNTASRCSTAPASPRTKPPPAIISAQGGPQGQPDRAEPAGADVRDRPRPAGRPGAGGALAPDRQAPAATATCSSRTSCAR